jgi:hypothetical protein
VRREGYAEEVTQLSIEVCDVALWTRQGSHHHVPEAIELMCEEAQGDGLAATGVSADQSEAALSGLVFES